MTSWHVLSLLGALPAEKELAPPNKPMEPSGSNLATLPEQHYDGRSSAATVEQAVFE
jgi:hypothetical protein